MKTHPPDSALAKAALGNRKESVSVVLYVAGIAIAFVLPWAACVLYIVVAAIWFIPDRRIERVLLQDKP